MRALRLQYLLTFATLGCVLPYLPVFFRGRGMNQTEVGLAFAIGSAAVLLSPVLVTLLADTRFSARSLMMTLLMLSALALLGLSLTTTLGLILLWYGLHSLATTPLIPLQDGILFAVQHRIRNETAARPVAYHRVRVWGTIGFIVPSLGLFWILRAGAPMEAAIVAGIFCALLSATVARAFLPDLTHSAPASPTFEPPGASRLPTLAALRALREPHVLVFCSASFLLGLATAPYYAFYPIYLTEVVGIDRQWIGIIASAGVLVEVFFMLGFGLLYDWLGLKWLVVCGFLATAARFALLAAFPTAAVAVATQVFHGMMVLMIAVVPPVFLNDHAEPRFRHSMQGLYVMMVMGLARIVGNLLAGPIAQESLINLFWYTTAITTAAAALVAVAFHHPRPAGEAVPAVQ